MCTKLDPTTCQTLKRARYAYKVVRKNLGRFWSEYEPIRRSPHGRYRSNGSYLEYKIGETVSATPRSPGIFCYRRFQDVRVGGGRAVLKVRIPRGAKMTYGTGQWGAPCLVASSVEVLESVE